MPLLILTWVDRERPDSVREFSMLRNDGTAVWYSTCLVYREMQVQSSTFPVKGPHVASNVKDCNLKDSGKPLPVKSGQYCPS